MEKTAGYEEFRKLSSKNKSIPSKPRPEWDEYFMQQALSIAVRSQCLRRSVGAVIVHECQILSTGYNGPPAGFDNPTKVGCYREMTGIPSAQKIELCRGLHAEQNAILLAAKRGISIDGGTIYCTHKPCITCQKMITNSGIVKVKYFFDYEDTDLILAEAVEKGHLELSQVTSPFLEKLHSLLNSHFGTQLTPNLSK